MSNLGNSIVSGVVINGMPLALLHPGKVFWVSNATAAAQMPGVSQGSDAGSTPGTFTKPFATVDYAIGRCTASRGDVIMVKPGHTETLIAAGTITSDIAGVAIVGVGTGGLRPTFTWNISTATWSITAANCSFYNLLCIGSLATPGVTTLFNVAAGGDNLTFDYMEVRDGSATLSYITGLTLASGVDNLTINNSKFVNASTFGGAICLTGVAGDGLYMENTSVYQNGVQAAVIGSITASGAVTNILIKDCYFASFVDAAVSIDLADANNSGLIANCYFSSNDAADANTVAVEASGAHCFECYMAGDADSYGIVGGGAVIYNNA